MTGPYTQGKNNRMRISLRLVPFILFFVFYALIQVSFTSLRHLQEKEDEKETKAIQEIVVDRFKRYLEQSFMLTKLGSAYITKEGIQKANYEQFAGLIQESKPEFLGFNVVDENGLIIRTFPNSGPNALAKGQFTQNFKFLMESLKKKETYYLSPPFRLLQGEQGFVTYVPILKSEKLLGWYAIVISSESFLKRFRLHDFLELFELTILDEKTGKDYFSTSLGVKTEPRVYAQTFDLFNRKMLFKTWRKKAAMDYQFPWYFSIFLSLIFALASGLILKFWGQKKKARRQLENISVLLRVTSKDALSNLIDIHSEFIRLNLSEDEKMVRLSRDINYLTNLIEQIDLLQTMAHNREGLSGPAQDAATIIETELEHFLDVFERKNILPVYNRKSLEKITIHVNEWLFGNSVLSNVFSHLLIHVRQDTKLMIEAQTRGPWQMIIFRIQRFPDVDNTDAVARRIDVARKVLQLHQGDLKEEMTADELIIRILLPK